MIAEVWCDQQLLISLRGPHGTQQIRTPGPFARIGRHPQSEVVLVEGQLPERACYLHATEQGIYCLPLCDTGRCEQLPTGWLSPGQSLAIGPYQITADLIPARLPGPPPRNPENGDAAVAEATASESTAPMQNQRRELRGPRQDTPLAAALAVSGPGRAAPLKWRMRHRLIVVGRAQPSDVRIKSSSISRVHLVLYWDDQQMWFVDLLSLNGTRTAGERADHGKLRSGQVLKFERIRVWYERTRPTLRVPRTDTAALDGLVLSGKTLDSETPSLPAFELTHDPPRCDEGSAIDLANMAASADESTLTTLVAGEMEVPINVDSDEADSADCQSRDVAPDASLPEFFESSPDDAESAGIEPLPEAAPQQQFRAPSNPVVVSREVSPPATEDAMASTCCAAPQELPDDRAVQSVAELQLLTAAPESDNRDLTEPLAVVDDLLPVAVDLNLPAQGLDQHDEPPAGSFAATLSGPPHLAAAIHDARLASGGEVDESLPATSAAGSDSPLADLGDVPDTSLGGSFDDDTAPTDSTAPERASPIGVEPAGGEVFDRVLRRLQDLQHEQSPTGRKRILLAVACLAPLVALGGWLCYYLLN